MNPSLWSWSTFWNPYYRPMPYMRHEHPGPSPGCKIGGPHHVMFLSNDCSSFQTGAHCCDGAKAVVTSCSRVGDMMSSGTIYCVHDDPDDHIRYYR